MKYFQEVLKSEARSCSSARYFNAAVCSPVETVETSWNNEELWPTEQHVR